MAAYRWHRCTLDNKNITRNMVSRLQRFLDSGEDNGRSGVVERVGIM